MVEKARGLPPTYDLNVPAFAAQSPAQLGDYLEEEDAPLAQQPTLRRNAPVSQPTPVAPASTRSPHVPRSRPLHPVPKPARLSTTVPRKQVNMTPDTLKMVEELLDYVCTYSVQKDVKASELFHALVLALYEARAHLDFSHVQPRGRWGTPTASALPIALKNAFQSAIADWHDLNQR